MKNYYCLCEIEIPKYNIFSETEVEPHQSAFILSLGFFFQTKNMHFAQKDSLNSLQLPFNSTLNFNLFSITSISFRTEKDRIYLFSLVINTKAENTTFQARYLVLAQNLLWL